MKPEPFQTTIQLTRPLLPDYNKLQQKLSVIWKNRWLTNMGPLHNEFESVLKSYLGAKNLLVYQNGTIALMLALNALNLTGEVITTPFTFPATVNAITWNKLEPVFCDIVPGSFNIDPELIEAKITPQTSAILAVHIFGTLCDVEKIDAIAAKHNLKVIYDAAHCIGLNNERLINSGDITMFSLHATKLFHTFEGGALTFKNSELLEKLSMLRNFGIKNSEEVSYSGLNGKLNEMQAAVGLCLFDKIQSEKDKRQRVRDEYGNAFRNSGHIEFKLPANSNDSLQYYVISIRDSAKQSRDQIHRKLNDYNLITRKYFTPLGHKYKFLQQHADNFYPVAEKYSKQLLALPFYGDLKPKIVSKIAELVTLATEAKL
jgi:dTDP-4-amino-4,6-dideoxygalactose transaminase